MYPPPNDGIDDHDADDDHKKPDHIFMRILNDQDAMSAEQKGASEQNVFRFLDGTDSQKFSVLGLFYLDNRSLLLMFESCVLFGQQVSFTWTLGPFYFESFLTALILIYSDSSDFYRGHVLGYRGHRGLLVGLF
jgi:hypothetical protein